MATGSFRLFIDGFNLYFGMKDAQLNGAKWLDLVDLGTRIGDGRTLDHVNYYTADIRRPDASRVRQQTYLSALRAMYPHRLTIRYGYMQWEPWECKNCSNANERRAEKQTDVNLAVDLVSDAYEDKFETAMVISGDSDLVGAVTAVRRLGKTVIVAFPPERKSSHLADAASGSFDISKTKLRQSQLPTPIADPTSAAVFKRPASWVPGTE